MKAEKSHDLLSAICTTRKASGAVSVSLKAQAQESGRWISQLRESTQTLPSSAFSFVLALHRLDMHSHWGGPSAFLSSPIKRAISFRNTAIDTPRNNVLPAIWASLS